MMRRDLNRILVVAALCAGSPLLLPTGCNLALGLENFKDCPEDPTCAASATCGDGVKDATETDVDCGGPCSPCADGKICKVDSDCHSTTCVGGICLASTCSDGIKDGHESDVDCGGSCPPCADGKGCVTGSDCVDQVCSDGACLAPSCTDGVKNGNETDVDCGGSCPACGFDKACAQNADCLGAVCTTEKCAAACTDTVENGLETGIDCGGPTCAPCADGGGCAADGDCESGICQSATCAAIDAWSKGFNDSMAGISVTDLAVAIDSSNDVIVTGNFEGSIDFGMGPLTSAGSSTGLYAKFDTNGNSTWSKAIYNAQADIMATAVDLTGNVYLTGIFAGSLDVIGANCTATSNVNSMANAYLAKLDPSGVPIWCQAYGTTGALEGRSLAIDATGNIIVAGAIVGTATFNSAMLTGASLSDYFVVKVDPTGGYVWAKAFPSSSIKSVVTDSAGNVILVGLIYGTTDFGGGQLTVPGMPGMYVAKLDPSGSYLWAKAFGQTGTTVQTASVTIDAQNNIFLAGGFKGTIDFGGSTFTSGGATAEDVFLVELDPSGAHLWGKDFADPFGAFATSVALDSKGQPVLFGSFAGTVDFGGGPLTSSGGQAGSDMFVAKFGTTGNHLWSRSFGDPLGQTPGALGIDSTGAAVVAGMFNNTLNFGDTPQTKLVNGTAGTEDIFLAKLRTP